MGGLSLRCTQVSPALVPYLVIEIFFWPLRLRLLPSKEAARIAVSPLADWDFVSEVAAGN